MNYQVKSSFPQNGKLISTFLHCHTLNVSLCPQCHHLPGLIPTSQDKDSALQWFCLLIDVLMNCLFSEDESQHQHLLARVFMAVCDDRKMGILAETLTFCFPPLACMFCIFATYPFLVQFCFSFCLFTRMCIFMVLYCIFCFLLSCTTVQPL